MNAKVGKLALLLVIWVIYVRVRFLLIRFPLAQVVQRLDRSAPSSPVGRLLASQQVPRLSRAVSRSLGGPNGPIKCLSRSLVLFGLLRSRGENVQLVIGVQDDSHSHEAHAWVELDGIDVGPRPGRMGRAELVRYPR